MADNICVIRLAGDVNSAQRNPTQAEYLHDIHRNSTAILPIKFKYNYCNSHSYQETEVGIINKCIWLTLLKFY